MNTSRMLLMAGCMAIALTACGREEAEDEVATTTAPPPPAETVPYDAQPEAASDPLAMDERTDTYAADEPLPADSPTGTDLPGDTQGATHSTAGVVTAIDLEEQTVTLEHEPVPTMDWPAMTMAFDVENEAVLKEIAVGDEIEFAFVQQGNDYVIVDIDE